MTKINKIISTIFLITMTMFTFNGNLIAGTIILEGKKAMIDGNKVRRTHIGIEGWYNDKAVISWDVNLDKAGSITVYCDQAAKDLTQKKQYEVRLAGEKIVGTVQNTGGWSSYSAVKAGTVKIAKPGKYRLEVQALSMKGGALMNLRSVILKGDAIADKVLPLDEQRGMYFSKKEYQPEPLPLFDENKDKLPKPILEANPEYEELYWFAWKLAFDHFKKPNAIRAGFVSNFLDEGFNGQIFQWDTVFMVMFARYGHHVFPAVQSFDNFYCKQHYDGFICREIIEANGRDYHKKKSPQAINPPLFSWAEMESFRVTGDKSRFAMILPVLEKYVEWLESNRKKKTVHNLYWNNNVGSGMDNTPRRGSGWVDMSVQMVMQYNDLAAICEVLGKEEKARDYRSRAKNIADLINEWMWNEEDGLYYDIDDKGKHAKWKTAACFWPMLAGISSKAQEEKLIANLKDPKSFWRKNVFPTLAADQNGYEATGGYWRGGVWAPTNYMIIRGLALRGYNEFAVQAADRYLDQLCKVYKETGTLWELYAPDFTTKGTHTHGPKSKHQARPDFVGWTGCGPIAMLIENMLGLRANAINNRLVWHLNRTDRHGIEKLRVGDTTLDLIAEKRADKSSPAKLTLKSDKPFEVEVIHPKGSSVYKLEPGKTLKVSIQ